MSLTSHLTQLRQKHALLARRIEEEQRRPGADEVTITAMKRQKLNIKDEIVRLENHTH